MSHPPIPPNCQFFSRSSDSPWHFNMPHTDGSNEMISISLAEGYSRIRAIIACVARCAWLDEARRVRSSLMGICDGIRWFDDTPEKHLPAYQAEGHAEEWYKWGRGEVWK